MEKYGRIGTMGNLKPGATYVYESHDGGKSVYARETGTLDRQLIGYSFDMIEHLKKVDRESQWMDILKQAEHSPALQEAIDRVIVLYELQKGAEPPQWHPV